MGKYLIFGVAMLFAGVLRLWSVDFTNATIPFLSPAAASPGIPESAAAIGTPAAITLPESDLATWFTPADGVAPDDPKTWAAVVAFANVASTPAGWAEACKKATAVAGAERATSPELGALACSSDATVTALQKFALQLLAARAEVTLWLRGIEGHDNGMVAARLGEVRHSCENGLPSRLASAESPYLAACTGALATVSLPADADALQAALVDAYLLVANDLAARDPSIDPEPPVIAEPAAPTPTP